MANASGSAESATIDAINSLVGTAYKYGPFLFSILFIFVVVGKAHIIYQEAIKEEKRPLGNIDIWVYWSFLLMSMSFSIGLVVYSIIWWSRTQVGVYAYTVEIRGIPESGLIQFCNEPRVYTRKDPRTEAGETLTDWKFTALSDQPFSDARSFHLQYFEKGAIQGIIGNSKKKPCPYSFQYSGHSKDIFELPSDVDNGGVLTLTESAN